LGLKELKQPYSLGEWRRIVLKLIVTAITSALEIFQAKDGDNTYCPCLNFSTATGS